MSFGQEDTVSVEKNNYWKIQFEATSIFLSNELGVLYDYDLASMRDGKYSFGFRISTEYYNQISFDVGGGGIDNTFLDVNLYGRHSIRGKYFTVSPFIGLSFHLLNSNSYSDFYLIKWGMEWEYKIYKDIVGIMLKWALSISQKDAGYLGFGISYKITNN
jgi:hypothetical protein